MVIENAERMGLAQLHQLRGRVGRGAVESFCTLLFQKPLSELARKRLETLRDSTDGFAIAQKDLELRGPGELLGTRQTGLAELKVADLIRDADLLPEVRSTAETPVARKCRLHRAAAPALDWKTRKSMAGWAESILYGWNGAPLLRRLTRHAQLMRLNRPIGIGPFAVADAVGVVDRRARTARCACLATIEAAAGVRCRHRGDALGGLRDQRLRGPQHRSACKPHQRASAGTAAALAS